MKFDYISDLHFDVYLNENDLKINNYKKLLKIYDNVFYSHKEEKRDYLIIAGDLANSNDFSIYGLNLLNKYYYKKIIFVLGNHDYYISKYELNNGSYQDSFDRIEEFKNLIKNNKNLIYLDGETIEIEGTTIGGFNSWYDGTFNYYYSHHYNMTESILQNKWKFSMLDSERIIGVEKYNDIFKIEIEKLKKIYKKCDILISHISPSYLKENFNYKYKNEDSNGFFSFNGHKYLESKKLKYWVFGHTHEIVSFRYSDTQVLANPYGYPHEAIDKKVKTIILNKD